MVETSPDRTLQDRRRNQDAGLGGLGNRRLVVVSNRQPYRHEWNEDEIGVNRPTGGLTSGLDSAMRGIDGTWIAWGDGDADADVVDADDSVMVPPGADEDEQYALRRVWLTEDQVESYYYGFSNRVLWPLCHAALTRVENRSEYWDHYAQVNEQFADVVADEVERGAIVWLQDYHLGLAPRMVRSRVPDDVPIAQFWHIPWPGLDVFRACPHGDELVRGLLGNDLLGFHVDRYTTNFLRCVDEMIPESRIDWETGRVFHRDGTTTVQAFPLGVDAARIHRLAADDAAAGHWSAFAAEHDIDEEGTIALGVDRLDYTKGIPERLEALERLWETRPEWREELTYVQVGTESRSRIPAYRELQDTVAEAVDRINARFGTDDWRPVVYTTERLSNEELYGLYRRADVALVSPIRDGMNLVAKEYVAARVENDGVLVLSDQTGVHDRFGESALTVTPQDTAGFTNTVETALTMSADERGSRMRSLRRQVHRNDVSGWLDDVLGTITTLRKLNDKSVHA